MARRRYQKGRVVLRGKANPVWVGRWREDVIGADGVTLQQFSESAGGQVVFHLHVHVIPRKEGIAMKPPATVKESPDVLKEQAAPESPVQVIGLGKSSKREEPAESTLTH